MSFWSLTAHTPFGATSPVSAIDWDALTHVSHVGVNTNPDGTLQNIRIHTAELLSAAHSRGKKVTLDIQPSVNMASAIENHLSTYVSNIMAIVNGDGYDGVDIDWEIGGSPARYQALLPALRTQLGPNRLLAVWAQPFQGELIAFQQYLDKILLMTYWLSDSYPISWFNSALFDGPNPPGSISSLDSAWKNWTSFGAVKDKLCLGIPFFGELQSGGGTIVTGPRQAVGNPRPSRTLLNYHDIIEQGYNISNPNRDVSTRVPWITTGNGWLNFDDVQSVTEKANFIKSENLGGWMLWELSSDYMPTQTQKHPLLNAVKSALGANMQKTATFAYGPIQVSDAIVYTSVKVDLLNSANSVVQTTTVAASAPSASFDVPTGTGWKIRATNLDQNGGSIGTPVLSNTFDVVNMATINIVASVAVS